MLDAGTSSWRRVPAFRAAPWRHAPASCAATWWLDAAAAVAAINYSCSLCSVQSSLDSHCWSSSIQRYPGFTPRVPAHTNTEVTAHVTLRSQRTHTHTHTHTARSQLTHTQQCHSVHTPRSQHTHTHTHTPRSQHTHTPRSQHTHTHTKVTAHTHTHTHTHTHRARSQHTHTPRAERTNMGYGNGTSLVVFTLVHQHCAVRHHDLRWVPTIWHMVRVLYIIRCDVNWRVHVPVPEGVAGWGDELRGVAE